MKIEKTASGKWTTRVCITDESGKKHFKRFTSKSKADVRNSANEYLNENLVYAESAMLSVCAERFLARSDAVLSPNTIRGYKISDRYFKRSHSSFYALQIDRVTSSALQSVIDEMVKDGLSAKTVSNRIGFLSSVFSADGRKLPRHTMPKIRQYEPTVPSQETISQVAGAAKGTRCEIPLALAIFGLRCAEVCAVQAEDIDDNNVLHVCRALATDDDGFVHEKPPKERASDRFIPLPPELADQIRKAGRATTMSPHDWSAAFPHLLNRAGVPEAQRFRLHDCRHFFVSYCHDVLKLSDAEIIKLSGHATDYVMKRVYRHAMSDHSNAVTTGLSDLINRSENGNKIGNQTAKMPT
jgi:integrase